MGFLGLPAAQALSVVGLAVLLAACGAEARAPLEAPTEGAIATAQLPLAPTPSPPEPTSPSALPADPTAAAASAYRAWMEEARRLYPYSEPIEAMWSVMLCESSGDATVVAAGHHGLFQYSAETWGGTWNPYRGEPILDPRAQIFATAKAWQDGNRSWWGCA
jgi:hypothetical protein